MGESTLDIILRTIKQGNGAEDTAKQLGAVDKASKTIKTTYTELKSKFDLFGGALDKVGQAWEATIGSTLAYAKSSRDAADAVGISIEEMQQLIQVADDAGVSQESLTSALQLATKNGFAPSIESLANLADKTNKIQDPTQRAAAYAAIFGRNWAALNPMLKEGGDWMRQGADTARRMGLIMSEEATRGAEDLRKGIDDLGDAWEGFKLKVTTKVIPVLNDLAAAELRAMEEDEAYTKLLDRNTPTIERYAAAKLLASRNTGQYQLVASQLLPVLEDEKNKLDAVFKVHTALTGAQQKDVIETARVKMSTKEYADRMYDLQRAKQHAIDQGFAPESQQLSIIDQKIKDLIASQSGLNVSTNSVKLSSDSWYSSLTLVDRGARNLTDTQDKLQNMMANIPSSIEKLHLPLSDLNGALLNAATSTDALTTAQLYQEAIKDLPIGAALDVAKSLGILNDNNYNVMKGLQVARAEYQKTGDIKAYETAIYNLNNQLEAVKTDIAIRVSLAIPDLSDYENRNIPRAGGGPVYVNEPVRINEAGPERFVPYQAGSIMPTNNYNTSIARGAIVINPPAGMNVNVLADAILNRLNRETRQSVISGASWAGG